MAYAQIDISEVGEPERPLISVLHQSIFSDAAEQAKLFEEGARDELLLIAHLEGNPMGYLVAQSAGERDFVISSLGVLPDYRRERVGSRLMAHAERFAAMLKKFRILLFLPEGCEAMQALAELRGYQLSDSNTLVKVLSPTEG